MWTRRQLLTVFGAMSLGAIRSHAKPTDTIHIATKCPLVEPPDSPHRLALIEDFRKRSEGLDRQFEGRLLPGDWTMPLRLFRPSASGKLPLVVYLHGSGGLGTDNEKQLALGNTFGTRAWLLPETQKRFPCFVVAPQTDRGWIRYDMSANDGGPAKPIAGLGDAARKVLDLIDALRAELPIDSRRIYVTGQSMGGAGVWNLITHRPNFFAAAVPVCAAPSLDDGTGSLATPVWNFHGAADTTVPVAVSRARIAARRKAGGQPIATEYAGVAHNAWEWAYTEPSLAPWLFAQRRRS